MTQLRDAIRHVGRTVVLVDDGEEVPAHVLAAGVGGLSVAVDGRPRFITLAEFGEMEIDADVDRLADETAPDHTRPERSPALDDR